jgi:hypothetical protein
VLLRCAGGGGLGRDFRGAGVRAERVLLVVNRRRRLERRLLRLVKGLVRRVVLVVVLTTDR